MYEAMSTISWSYSAAGAGDAKASPAEACTMVVENARAVLCRENERLEEKEDLAACWATNLLELRSGALTMVLRAAALAKLRLAMALIVRGLRSLLEGRGRKRDDDCTATTSQWLRKREMGGGGRESHLKPMVQGRLWGCGGVIRGKRRCSRRSDRMDVEHMSDPRECPFVRRALSVLSF
jgi:hypothetical protein